MNIFNVLKIYAGKWSVKETRDFTPEEVAAVSSASVVASEYGNSVCFYMKSGGMTFIPLSQDSTKGIGETIKLEECKLITLCKEGESDIVRVFC